MDEPRGNDLKTWYFAKCAKCCEAKHIFVNNPSVTEFYLSDWDKDIQAWLEKHSGCELTLGWRDDHLDKLWEEGYLNKDMWWHK